MVDAARVNVRPADKTWVFQQEYGNKMVCRWAILEAHRKNGLILSLVCLLNCCFAVSQKQVERQTKQCCRYPCFADLVAQSTV